MQDASAAFDAAMDGVVTWNKPDLLVGWRGQVPIERVGTVPVFTDPFDARNVQDGWTTTPRYTFDTTSEGWAGEGATSVIRITTAGLVHDGAGSLQATKTMGAGFDSIRFNDAQGLRNLLTFGPNVSVWAQVPAGTPGTGWLAHIEVQDPSFAWIPAADVPMTPGTWVLLKFRDTTGLFSNFRSWGIQFSATGVGGSASVVIDTFIQYADDLGPAVWNAVGTSPTLLDVSAGAATIANNVIAVSQGARMETVDAADSPYIVDWEAYTVVSANVLPTGAPYAWLVRFTDAAGTNRIDLFIRVELTTNRVHYTVFRNHASGSDTLIFQTYVQGVTYTPDAQLGVRIAGAGGRVFVSVWDNNGNEPPDWVTIGRDTRASFTGRLELRSFLDTSNTNGTVTFSYHTVILIDHRVLGDMRNRAGQSWKVSHALDDGMPDAVSSSVSADPYGSASINVIGAYPIVDSRRYYSLYNPDSPLYGIPRDIPLVRLRHGAQTSSGPESVPVFTGQMIDLPLSGRAAEISAISQTRMRLAKAVSPPIINGPLQGGEGSWLASYIMWACGVELMPPPNPDTTQIWVPGHGSMRPFVPYSAHDADYSKWTYAAGAGATNTDSPPFIDGYYYRAVNSYLDRGDGRLFVITDITPKFRLGEGGSNILTQSSPRGRVELMVKGMPNPPEITSFWDQYIAWVELRNGGGGLFLGAIDANRALKLVISDDVNPQTHVDMGLTLPDDGQWHAVGWSFDLTTDTYTAHLDGLEHTVTGIGMDDANLPTADDDFHNADFWSAYPWSDLLVQTGQSTWNYRGTQAAGTSVAFEDWEDTTYNIAWSGGWVRANDQAFAGTWSLKSGAIGNYGISGIRVDVPALANRMDFRLRLSTQNTDMFEVLAPYVLDTGSRVVANSWGTPDIGPAWGQAGGAASDYAATGSATRHLLDTTNVERISYLDTLSVDGDITVDVNFGIATAAGAPIRIRFRGRGTGADIDNNIYGQLELDAAGDVRINVNQRVLGVASAITSSVVAGNNGAGSTWRVRFEWWGQEVRITAYNVTTPSAPVTVRGTHTNKTLAGTRIYLSSVRVLGNTSGTITVTYDNLLVNARPLYRGSGVVNAWRETSVNIPAGVTKLYIRYAKDVSGTGGSDAVWIDNVDFRTAAPIISTWTAGAIARAIDIDLQAIVERAAREGWAWLSELCQSSMTALRVDETDRLMILPPSYFVETSQLAVTDTITTTRNAQDPDVNFDPTKIRNSVQVDFTEVTVDSGTTDLLRYKTVIEVAPGRKVVEFSLDLPAVLVNEAIQVPQFYTGLPEPQFSDMIYVNTASDGSGAYLDATRFEATVIAWDSTNATVEFINKTSARAYIVNNFEEDTPYLRITGQGVTTAEAAVSVSDVRGSRGERTLTVQAPAVQTRDNARRLAAALLWWVSRPRPEVSVTVFGDPRRQPGDLYTLADPTGTQIGGLWRPLAIEHIRKDAEYTQALFMKTVAPVAEWDNHDAGWDEGVWAE